MLIKAADNGYIKGLMSEHIPGGVISLQYADDTLLFLENDANAACHLKWLMVCFEHLSGMKINYNKSDMTSLNLSDEETNQLAKIFCCKIGKFPFRYLGVPLHYEKLRREDIQPIVDKVLNRIAGWKGRLLSCGGRLTLLKACLVSIPIYLLSVIKFPKWAIDAINTQMANFFWDDQENKHKYHLANWQLLAQKKEFGGVGIPDIRNLNLCLLASWIYRYFQGDGKLWKQVVDQKYKTKSPNLFFL